MTAAGGEQMILQLAYFDRGQDPVVMDIGPVLDLEDVVGGKVCALASRVEPRDYADVAAALERYSPAQLIGFARRLDPGLTGRDFADAGRRLDQIDDRAFTEIGLSVREVAALRERLAIWPGTPAAPIGSPNPAIQASTGPGTSRCPPPAGPDHPRPSPTRMPDDTSSPDTNPAHKPDGTPRPNHDQAAGQVSAHRGL